MGLLHDMPALFLAHQDPLHKFWEISPAGLMFGIELTSHPGVILSHIALSHHINEPFLHPWPTCDWPARGMVSSEERSIAIALLASCSLPVAKYCAAKVPDHLGPDSIPWSHCFSASTYGRMLKMITATVPAVRMGLSMEDDV